MVLRLSLPLPLLFLLVPPRPICCIHHKFIHQRKSLLHRLSSGSGSSSHPHHYPDVPALLASHLGLVNVTSSSVEHDNRRSAVNRIANALQRRLGPPAPEAEHITLGSPSVSITCGVPSHIRRNDYLCALAEFLVHRLKLQNEMVLNAKKVGDLNVEETQMSPDVALSVTVEETQMPT
ncbi:unnamed protein product [Vitrella brassicaformis CCMP3155]|uniref:Uncharacterized protein n=1 Tax=Vitrella brassicaformis (strain CCMP3155) TaxID=1169540 RepID=A0A0G4EPC1_VITBC|nr:unnamed protein product [Vitrella brassicaformis CCMP3155]|eukprot:CEL98945.1 unnamed protein product [Vitrella brassicaformis CCMP3155]